MIRKIFNGFLIGILLNALCIFPTYGEESSVVSTNDYQEALTICGISEDILFPNFAEAGYSVSSYTFNAFSVRRYKDHGELISSYDVKGQEELLTYSVTQYYSSDLLQKELLMRKEERTAVLQDGLEFFVYEEEGYTSIMWHGAETISILNGPISTTAAFALLQTVTYPSGTSSASSSDTVDLRITSSWTTEIDRTFQQDFSNINIVDMGISETSTTLLEQMLTGSPDYDIFVIGPTSTFENMKQKGYIQDISSLNECVSLIDALYPQLQEVCKRNQSYYAVPVFFRVGGWSADLALWDELNMGEYPNTYWGFLHSYSLWCEENKSEDTGCMFFLSGGIEYQSKEALLSRFIHDYILQYDSGDGSFSFNTDMFRACVQEIYDIPATTVSDENNGNRCLFDIDGYNLGATPSNNARDRIVMPFANSDEAIAVSADCRLYAINPKSEHIAEAEQYLQYIATHLDSVAVAAMSPSAIEGIQYSDWEQRLDSIQSDIAEIQAFYNAAGTPSEADEDIRLLEDQSMISNKSYLWQVSPEECAAYHAMARNICFGNASELLDGARGVNLIMDDQSKQFLSGKMNMDQFIQSLERITRMVYQE